MLLRIWHVKIDPARVDELENFAQTYSLPMFQQQAGCLGVLFTWQGNDCATISLWQTMDAIEKLKTSPTYAETVRQLEATGMLGGEQSVELFQCFGGFLNLDVLADEFRQNGNIIKVAQ